MYLVHSITAARKLIIPEVYQLFRISGQFFIKDPFRFNRNFFKTIFGLLTGNLFPSDFSSFSKCALKAVNCVGSPFSVPLYYTFRIE